MRFWDSSALVPLVSREPASAACVELLAGDDAMAVWAFTRLEMASAVRRKERDGELTPQEAQEAFRRISLLERAWTEVDGVRPVRARAERLLAVHPLRAADALQLAAALVLTGERPTGYRFVTRDDRLAAAARAEGFELIVPR